MNIRTYNFGTKNPSYAYIDNDNRRLLMCVDGETGATTWTPTELESMPSLEQVLVAAKPGYLVQKLLGPRMQELDVDKTYAALSAYATELRLRKIISAAALRELKSRDALHQGPHHVELDVVWRGACGDLSQHAVYKLTPLGKRFLSVVHGMQRKLAKDLCAR
jgi:hypothetical protein